MMQKRVERKEKRKKVCMTVKERQKVARRCQACPVLVPPWTGRRAVVRQQAVVVTRHQVLGRRRCGQCCLQASRVYSLPQFCLGQLCPDSNPLCLPKCIPHHRYRLPSSSSYRLPGSSSSSGAKGRVSTRAQ